MQNTNNNMEVQCRSIDLLQVSAFSTRTQMRLLQHRVKISSELVQASFDVPSLQQPSKHHR